MTLFSPLFARFLDQRQLDRHKLIYKILDEELNVKGLHALQLVTRTPKEEEKA